MQVHSFLHSDTETYTHVLADVQQQLCAIIDPVLDFDTKSGRTSTKSIDEVIEFVRERDWQLLYIIETHAHADHLSAAIHVKENLGGQLVIGQHITEVQKIFKQIFNFDTSFRTDASQFDILTDEGKTLALGDITITAMYVPGHTRADMAYRLLITKKQWFSLVIPCSPLMSVPHAVTSLVGMPKCSITLFKNYSPSMIIPSYICVMTTQAKDASIVQPPQ